MDYEKKYKEALERAKKKYTKCYSPALLDYIFPELKSEDVEIRRSIISNLKRYVNCIKDGYGASSAKDFVVKEIEKQIAWLEKQEEKKPTLPKWKYKNDNTPLLRDSLILNKYGCVAKSPSGAFVNDVWVIDYDELAKLPKEELEKQGEQKSIDKFEPKFKVGDWVVFDNGNVEHITSVGTHGYTFDDGDYLLHDECDKIAHLWSIQDAKDGDVLFHSDSASNGIFIFKEIIDKGFAKEVICYCDYDSEDHFCLGEHHTCCWTDAKILYPATKEQRDLLFQKMKEAGYIFDFEKKELKKLSQSEVTKTSDQEEIAEIPFGAKDSELQEATYFIPKGFHAEIKGDIVLIKKGKQKFEWSEEDEHRLKDTIYFLDTAKKHYASTVELDACIDWLKSLKPHKQWKPSDEQMLALEAKITIPPQSPAMTSALIELYQQLKKL